MTTVEFIVWQFVRLMVHLEEHGPKGRGSLYEDWRREWEELDRRLTELGRTDAAAYSQLMMSETVVIDCRSAAHLSQAIAALDGVIRQLKTSIAQSADTAAVPDLEFECEGLKALRKGLAGILAATTGGARERHGKPRWNPRKPDKTAR